MSDSEDQAFAFGCLGMLIISIWTVCIFAIGWTIGAR